MINDPYTDPDTFVLRNKLGLTSQKALDAAERKLTLIRQLEGIPEGNFDLLHLQKIHQHLFQDLYDWAGELRSVEISKNGNQFMFRRYIVSGMSDVHNRLKANYFFKNLDYTAFAQNVGLLMGDINYIHPFREGNGRTQLHYLKQLCSYAGHSLNLLFIDNTKWIDASQKAHDAIYEPMIDTIKIALEKTKKLNSEI